MKPINYHIKGVIETFKAFAAGKFLIYFIPGAVITIIYLYLIGVTRGYQDAIDLNTGYSWVDWATGYVKEGIDWGFSGLYGLLEYLYAFIILTALSPFNTSLAEKFDNSLTGKEFEFNLLRLINDFIRMIFIVILAILLEFCFMIIYWMLSWIFGLDAIDPIVEFIIASFFFGFSFYDFALERYEKGVGSSLHYAFSNPLLMILTGAIFLGIYQIPVVGIPISVVLAVMISTVAYLYSEKKLPKENTPSTDKNLDNV